MKKSWDPNTLRRDFPIFSRTINGKPLVYLDNTATTQKPKTVIEAMTRFYSESNANVHRGGYTLGAEASALWESAREGIASFIGSPSPNSLIFTKNATESINLAAYSLSRSFLKRGDLVVTTEMEHHSNLVPWQQLAREYGFEIDYVRVTKSGTLDLDSYRKLLARKPRVVAFTHCSNVLGTLNDAKALTAEAKGVGALVLVDGCQAVPHFPVNVADIGCDFYAFSGHKMLGPTGIGALYGRAEVLEELKPFLYGGDMISEVTLDGTEFNVVPRKFEAGTPPVAEGIGLLAAIEYLRELGMDSIRAHGKELVGYAIRVLEEIGGVEIYGPKDLNQRSGIVSFNVTGVHPHDGASVLDTFGICVRSGDHCGQPLMRALGMQGTLRASFYIYNSKSEVDLLAEGLLRVKKIFGV